LFGDADELLMIIKEVCESIEKAVLERIFHEWREKPVNREKLSYLRPIVEMQTSRRAGF
jgi:hypothetical protein